MSEGDLMSGIAQPHSRAPGAGASEQHTLEKLTRQLTQVRVLAQNLHHDLPAGDRHEMARYVRDRLMVILDGDPGQ